MSPLHATRRRRWLAALAAAGWLGAALGSPAGAFELRLSTENDLLVESRQKDDLYTFAVALEVARGPYTVSFRENAFTDRAAAVRFDESYLSVGRAVPLAGPWQVYAEAGLVRVGSGLFGQDAQNTVHDLIGGEQVDFSYDGSSLHGRLAVNAERAIALGEHLVVGPRLELDAVPGLHSHAVIAGHARWQPPWPLRVDVMAGARLSDASHPALAPHVARGAPVARVGVLLLGRFTAAWSYNDYGDEREHLSVGYRIAAGGRR